MKALVLGDLHIEFEEFHLDNSGDYDIVILPGDIAVGDEGLVWAMENFKDKKVLYVPGNHEYYHNNFPNLLSKLKVIAENTNVAVMNNDKLIIDNTVFLGTTLWSGFDIFGDKMKNMAQAKAYINDYNIINSYPMNIPLSPYNTLAAYEESVIWLKSELEQHKNDKVVVITHHAPSLDSVPEVYKNSDLTPAFVANMHHLIEDYECIRFWIHGHGHFPCDYYIGNCRVINNCRGYPHENIQSFDKNFILDI